MQSVRLMQWVSTLLALSIGGVGFAPLAEYFGFDTLRDILKWIGWLSAGGLSIAALVVGGLGIYHGFLVITGQEVPTVRAKPEVRPLEPEIFAADG